MQKCLHLKYFPRYTPSMESSRRHSATLFLQKNAKFVPTTNRREFCLRMRETAGRKCDRGNKVDSIICSFIQWNFADEKCSKAKKKKKKNMVRLWILSSDSSALKSRHEFFVKTGKHFSMCLNLVK